MADDFDTSDYSVEFASTALLFISTTLPDCFNRPLTLATAATIGAAYSIDSTDILKWDTYYDKPTRLSCYPPVPEPPSITSNGMTIVTVWASDYFNPGACPHDCRLHYGPVDRIYNDYR